jgi:putative transcriptional regulator
MVKNKNLQDHFLVTMPSFSESVFDKGIIYICEHNTDGAMGIMINKPIPNIETLLSQLDIKDLTPKPSVYLGGPVDINKGFVIHEKGYKTKGTQIVSNKISLTSNLDIINDILEGKGPNNYRFALGYSGWGPGQLEEELKRGDWLVLPAHKQIMFGTPDDMMWSKACKKLGIDLNNLAGPAGIS